MTFNPIFRLRTPEINPRTEWACQPVAFIKSAPVAPPDRFSRSRNFAVLVPRRPGAAFFADLAGFAPRLAFFAGAACLLDLPLDGATLRARAPTRGFLAGVGSADGAVASPLAAFSGTTF